MSDLRLRWCVAFLMMVGVVSLSYAQQTQPATQGQQPAAAPTGSVTGTVLAQDTQRPVRFAQVVLQSVESVASAGSDGARGFLRGPGRGGQGSTEIDGTFNISNVAPGDYYVTASALGYITERSVLLAAVNAGSDPGQLLAGLPVVHVAADSSSNVNVSLQRGGALSGRVLWEDGSGAAAVTVTAVSTTQQSTQLPAPLSGLQLNGFGQLTVTDDRGDFRISGLPTGEYLLQATIQGGGQLGGFAGVRQQLPSVIRTYAPGVFRKSGAKAYSVRAGDERTDVRLTIDLRGLHTVSGHVGSANSGQTVASGRVSLTDSGDSSLQLQGAIDAEGDFTVRYVPPGNYSLQIIGASTQAGGFRGRGGDSSSTTPAVSFQSFSQAVVVGDTDVSGFVATLTPVQTAGR